MRVHQATPLEIDSAELKFRSAQEGDYKTLLSDSVDVRVGEELAIAYRVLEQFPADLFTAFRALSYRKESRTAGLVTNARTIGFAPRVTLRRDYCNCSAVAQEHPVAHAKFLEYARLAAQVYAEVNPQRYEASLRQMEATRLEWRLPNTPFTSGICNKDSSLRYHHDAGNYTGTWSCMYALSSGCAGGNLVVPSLDLAFSFQKPALIMFDGQSLLHGVTPLRKRNDKAYRYSVVFYGLKAMKNCLSPQEELVRIRQLRVKRERKRAGLE